MYAMHPEPIEDPTVVDVLPELCCVATVFHPAGSVKAFVPLYAMQAMSKSPTSVTLGSVSVILAVPVAAVTSEAEKVGSDQAI
jgi:hypothetical protein